MADVISMRRHRSGNAMDRLSYVVEPVREQLDALYAADKAGTCGAGFDARQLILTRLERIALPRSLEGAVVELRALYRADLSDEVLIDARDFRIGALEGDVMTSRPAESWADVFARLRWALDEAHDKTFDGVLLATLLERTLDDLEALAPDGDRAA